MSAVTSEVTELHDEIHQIKPTCPELADHQSDRWKTLHAVDPTTLGSMSERAIQALEDVEYWRGLCPKLRLTLPGACEITDGSGFKMLEERASELRAQMQRDGVFCIEPDELSWEVDLTCVAESIEILHEEGWPPTFIFAYDEPWIMAAQLERLIQQLTGNKSCCDFLAFRVPAGKAGFPPHRDKNLTGHSSGNETSLDTGFRVDGTPRFVTCWVPIVDVPETSSCLMCVPAVHDAGYAVDGGDNPALSFDNIRPLPMAAGGAIIFSHRLFHWGKTGDAEDEDGNVPHTRMSLAFCSADDNFEAPRLSRDLLPFPPLHLRVALAAGESLEYGLRSTYDDETMDLLWSCFVACRQNFSTTFANDVFEAKCALEERRK